MGMCVLMLVVMVVGVPVIVELAVSRTVGLVVVVQAASLHGVLEVFRTMGMVVIETDHPLVQLRVPLVHARCGAVGVLHRVGPGIVMEVIKQSGVCATQGDTAIFGGKSPVVDVGRTPEVTAGGNLTELHHPGGAPQVIGLLRAIMVGNIVLVKRGRHAVEKRHGMRDRVVVEQLDQAARGD